MPDELERLVTRIYRVTEKEKEVLSNLRHEGESNRAMLQRLGAVAMGMKDINPPDRKLVNHRFDFPKSVFDALKAKAKEASVPLIYLVMLAAHEMKNRDDKMAK